MPNLKFIGPQHYREITKEDWERVGVDDQDGIYVAGNNAFVRAQDFTTSQVVELSDDAAEFLLGTEPELWEETDEAAGQSPIKSRAEEARLLRTAAIEKAQAERDAGLEGNPQQDGLQTQVPSGTIDAVKTWVGDDANKAQAALDVETSKPEEDQRSSLVSWLEGVIDEG